MLRTDDTIVAVSSPPGIGSRAIVRLSGPAALALAGGAFASPGQPLEQIGGFRVADGMVPVRSGGIDLPARAYVFRSPRSFTGQDVVELHIPAGPLVADVVTELIEAGARQAEPGEFTARALFGGRIDLSEAEAVADVINADSNAQLRLAMASLGGRLWRLCSQAVEQVTDVLAAVEASVDLAGQDVYADPPGELAERCARLGRQLVETAAAAADLPEMAGSPTVVLAGRANVGKSSLLNALSDMDRAIVSGLAGTTRDVITTTMSLPGRESVSLVDVAGLVRPLTSLDAAADGAARAAAARADVIAFVVDSAASDWSEDMAMLANLRKDNPAAAVLLVANKVDLLVRGTTDAMAQLRAMANVVPTATSALTGAGLDQLRVQMAAALHSSGAPAGGSLGLHHRQKRCLLAGAEAVEQAARILSDATETADVAELVAIDLREGLRQLGQISGQVVSDDILARIFQRFCVGK